MPNVATAPTAATLPTLDILGEGGVVLDSVPVIQAGGHAYTRNKQGYQPYAVDEQGASGDGRRIPGSRTIDVLIVNTSSVSAAARLYALDAALQDAATLRLDGTSIDIAGSSGFTATQPLTGDRAGDLRATITYYPRTQAATNSSGESVLGPL